MAYFTPLLVMDEQHLHCSPRTQLTEHDDSYKLSVATPGYKDATHLKVSVDKNVLTVKGEHQAGNGTRTAAEEEASGCFLKSLYILCWGAGLLLLVVTLPHLLDVFFLMAVMPLFILTWPFSLFFVAPCLCCPLAPLVMLFVLTSWCSPCCKRASMRCSRPCQRAALTKDCTANRSFSYSVRLASDAVASKMTAKYEHGLLEVCVPKNTSAPTRKEIPIQVYTEPPTHQTTSNAKADTEPKSAEATSQLEKDVAAAVEPSMLEQLQSANEVPVISSCVDWEVVTPANSPTGCDAKLDLDKAKTD